MGQFKVAALILGVALGFPLSSSASTGELTVSESPKSKSKNVSKDLLITDHWFFTTSWHNMYDESYTRSEVTTVNVGQKFGFRVLYFSKRPKLKLKVELKVPYAPQNFPSHSGKTSISGNTITVEDTIEGSKGDIAYYWGIAPDDPLGSYELKFSLEGVTIQTYSFTVK